MGVVVGLHWRGGIRDNFLCEGSQAVPAFPSGTVNFEIG
jgi:hypothetical protein